MFCSYYITFYVVFLCMQVYNYNIKGNNWISVCFNKLSDSMIITLHDISKLTPLSFNGVGWGWGLGGQVEQVWSIRWWDINIIITSINDLIKISTLNPISLQWMNNKWPSNMTLISYITQKAAQENTLTLLDGANYRQISHLDLPILHFIAFLKQD